MAMTARPLPEQWRSPIDQWEARLRADGFAPGTIRDRIRAVRRAALAFAGCPWDLTAARLDAYAGQQAWSEQTRGTWVRTVRLFFEFAVSRGWTSTVPTPARHEALVHQPVVLQWKVELASWAGWMTAADCAPGTIVQRTYHVRRLATAYPELGPWDLQLEDIIGWMATLECGTNARRSIRTSITGFYRWGHQTGRVRVNPAAEVPPVRRKKGSPRPAPEHAIQAALGRADDRVRLMVLLGALAGLRRAEIAAVHTDDVVHYPSGWVLRVEGKGGHTRRIPLTDELGEILGALPPGQVFPGQQDGHLSPGRVGVLMRQALDTGWTPHSLRHRFASQAYAGDRDILAVQRLMGHADVSTTQIYTDVPDGALRAAVLSAGVIGC